MTNFPVPQVVRAYVRIGEQIATTQIAMTLDWVKAPITARKWTVRKAKHQLLQVGGLCMRCADSHDPYPPVCLLHERPRVTVWDGHGDYPVTGDMLRVYEPSTRFNLVAVIPPEELKPCEGLLRRTTQYAGLELRAPEWVDVAPADRHRHMREVVDRLLQDYPTAEHSKVRTLVFDGTREIPYPFNWRGVLGDQAR
ncbi:hypothetical protein HCJ76_43895 [Streptomyces sp. MC1]|uniref:hypothetical protein n=1 Tax=Streptomyces sp. MC1 TaxID=295105 RepID=UPI0018CABD52|nr:hypothetical protein [Streptomyces sp. MC1]MBG7704826.1 hypothetical protein [Streptomyces sp. MC1]